MESMTLGTMLRSGGFAAYVAFGLGVFYVVWTVIGFVLAGRRGKAAVKGWWSWVLLIVGALGALNAGLGVLAGLVHVDMYVQTHAAEMPCSGNAGFAGTPAIAQGSFEVLFAVAFGFMFPLLALYFYKMVRLAAAAHDRGGVKP